MTTYTSPYGSTFQGNQLNQTQAMLNNPISPPTTNQLTSAMGQTGQELAAMQTPQARVSFLSTSDLPAMQGNYDDVARKLFEYDKMNLNPMYSQPPGQPSDAAAFGRVEPSSLMQLTPELAGGPTTLFADNPRYAIASQTGQKENVLDILGSLNIAIGREFESRRGQYASTVKAKQSIIDTITGLLDRRIQVEEKAKDRALDLYKINKQASKVKEDATKEIWDKIYTTADTEDDIWRAINENDTAWRAMGIDVDQLWANHKDVANKVGYGGKLGLGLGEKEIGISKLAEENKTDSLNMVAAMDRYITRRGETDAVQRLNPIDPVGKGIETEKNLLTQVIAKLIEKNRLSDADRKFYLDQVPPWWMPQNTAIRQINGIKKGLFAKLGLVEVREKSTGMVGVITTEEFDPSLYEET